MESQSYSSFSFIYFYAVSLSGSQKLRDSSWRLYQGSCTCQLLRDKFPGVVPFTVPFAILFILLAIITSGSEAYSSDTRIKAYFTA